MKKKTIIISIITIIIIIFLIFYLFINKKSDEYRPPMHPCDSNKEFINVIKSKKFENCPSIKNESCAKYCIFRLAAFGDDPKNCIKLQDVGDRDNCYRYLAIGLKDISLCDKITTNHGREYCIWSYNFRKERNDWPR